MKKLSKIKLNQFSKEELNQRKMNALKGGCACTYGCHGCGGGCTCNDWLAGGIISANNDHFYATKGDSALTAY